MFAQAIDAGHDGADDIDDVRPHESDRARAMNARPIIIDTDPGQDDAIAILLALASPELEVTAITSVAGNVPQPLVTENSLGLLALAGREDVPVYRGCERPLLRDLVTAEYVHGPTGVDGAVLPAATVEARTTHGVDHIIDACREAPDASVTLCPIGPLTNIGMAIAKEPSIIDKIREIVWMGGAFDEAGNTTPVAEFNAYVDPHAVHIVFTSGIPLTIFPLDVTHKALMLPRHIELLASYGTRIAEAAAGMIRFYEIYDIDKYDIPGAPLHDPCVVAYLVDTSLFQGARHHVLVDTTNEETIGNTYVDDSGGEPNALIITDVDAERFFTLVVERIGQM
ncbi:Inosine-uridine preferring nucleoside hydrolase [hydrothermal vent metagenome]|uniref:Inosine-uridine preferring nucleoside hydrolase n=1 Tax=hydrothermal vent metagenome TaxID=652676 RepID=A0A3B0SKL6_9ZZZZ